MRYEPVFCKNFASSDCTIKQLENDDKSNPPKKLCREDPLKLTHGKMERSVSDKPIKLMHWLWDEVC
jgi:hypothetical protein